MEDEKGVKTNVGKAKSKVKVGLSAWGCFMHDV